MPADLLKRIDLDHLYLPFAERLLGLLAEARKRGVDYHVISGFRSYIEQDGLYAQGRSTPGAVVTNARGGESAHQFGIAADLCRDADVTRHGLQPDWEPESYELLRELCPLFELVWGGTFHRPDRPHVQARGYVTAKQLKPLREAFEVAGLKGAWRYLDKH